jgi:hypothetical protein
VLDAWNDFEATRSSQQRQTLLEGAGNRLQKFLWSKVVQTMVGSEVSLDLASIMNKGQVLLVNLADKGNLSHENAQLLGTFLLSEVFRVAKTRTPDDPRNRPVYVYVDEFANYVTKDIARSLEELRKFNVFFIFAHQHLDQLKTDDEYIFNSVLTNCTTKIAFGGLSYKDARIMAEELFTGYLDHKKVKDEIYATRTRLIEELRTTKSTSFTNSKGKNQQSSQGNTITNGVSYGLTQGQGKATTKTESWSSGINEGTSRGYSHTDGYGYGYTETETESDGWGTTESSSEGDSIGWGSSVGGSRSYSSGSSQVFDPDLPGETLSIGLHESYGQTSNWSDSYSGGFHQSRSRSESESHSQSLGHSQSESTFYSDCENYSENSGTSESEGGARSEQRSQSQGRSQTQQYSQGDTIGTSQGTNEGTSQTITHSENWCSRPEEYKELSNRTFVSLDQLIHEKIALIKNQPVQHALVKIGDDAPLAVRIKDVEPVEESDIYSQRWRNDFRQSVYRHHADIYSSADAVQEAIAQRKRNILSLPTENTKDYDEYF